MNVVPKRLRRSAAFAAAAGTLLAFGSAGAFVGSGGGPLVTTNAPDLRSATITTTANPTDNFGPSVRWCFDVPIATVITGAALRIGDYDSGRNLSPGQVQLNNQTPACVDATYADGADIEQGSYAYLAIAGAVEGVGAVQAPQQTVPLTGSKVGSVPGSTTAPDLINAQLLNNTQVLFTFDEKLDPAFGNPANFGYYQDTQNGANPTTGVGATITGSTARVNFAASITSAKQFVVFGAGGGVRDVTTNGAPANRVNTIASAGTQIVGSPGLSSAVKAADNQTVRLTFSQAVTPQSATGVVAYRDDGQPLGANVITTSDDVNNTTLLATLAVTAQDDPTSIVRVGVGPAAASARSDNTDVVRTVWSSAPIGTCRCTPGYTDGPDLLSTVIDDNTNRITYTYDEPILSTFAPPAAGFGAVRPDGTVLNGLDGVIVSADRRSVQVHFGASVAAIVAVSHDIGAVVDASEQNNPAPVGAVGEGAASGSVPTGGSGIPGVPPPSTPTSPTTSTGGTATPGPTGPSGPTGPVRTVTPTPPSGSPTIELVRRASRISLRRKRSGRRYSGRVSARFPCRAERKIRLFQGLEKLSVTRTSDSGRFSVRLSRARPAGTIRAYVTKSTVIVRSTAYVCGARTSKTV